MEWLKTFGRESLTKNIAKMDKILDNKKKFQIWGDTPVIKLTKSEAYLKSRIAKRAQEKFGGLFCVILEKDNPRIRVKTNSRRLDLLDLFKEFKPEGHPPTCGFYWEKSLEELKDMIISKSDCLF